MSFGWSDGFGTKMICRFYLPLRAISGLAVQPEVVAFIVVNISISSDFVCGAFLFISDN